MMKTKLTRRVLTTVLMLGMLLSLLPTAALAASDSPSAAGYVLARSGNNEGLKLNKTARLEDDGTYTITLEAYATGEVTTTTTIEKEPVPADIIMILDQSGSMSDDMTGIPSNTWDPATVTNAGINQGSYYYLVNGRYYKVTAVKELVSSSMEYVGDDGKTYQASELSTSWARKSDGQVYHTARPFVTASLSTWTRSHSTFGLINRFFYVNDANGTESSKELSAAGARTSFSNAYGQPPYTAEFHNDGAPSAGDTSADDPYYVAARYIAVTQQEVKAYRYTYTYVNDNGATVTIGSSETGTEAVVDGQNASIDLYVQGTTDGDRLAGLKYAVNQFVSAMEATGDNHRIALVGFASDGYKHEGLGTLDWENTELFVGSAQYNYNDGNKGNSYAAAHYAEALQDVSTQTGRDNVAASVNALAADGATFPQWGFTMAQGIYDNSDSTYVKEDGTVGKRNRIVIFFTDGYPGYNYENPDTDEANATVSKANVLKGTDYGATVYCVACIESLTEGSDGDTFLKNVSSDGTYMQATSATALSDFFKYVEHQVTDTTVDTSVTLTENAVLVDELTDYFTVPEDFDVTKNVKVQTAKHVGYESFATPVDAVGVTVVPRRDSNDKVTGIDVSGFNYLGDNMVTTDDKGGSVRASGNKLVVTISGLLAKDAAATGVYVDTNTASSGIWDKDNNDLWAEIKAFPVPHTLLDKKLFVMDYAKGAPLDVYNATRVDSADDGLFSKVDESSTSLTGTYGAVSSANGLTYTPNTTLWDGWDSFYALGKDATKGDRQTQNIWSKVSVLPANNVYYEDTFVTNEETGTVGIVYSADGWQTVSAGSNTGDVNNDEQGWITSMNDDATYSDGTAATGSTGATATFSFTGTGVDIYSKTDMTTGLVVVKLYKGENTTAAASMVKSLTVDNLSQSDEYYQIPTASFSGLPHDTYTVKLTVAASSAAATGEKRSTYYLDGIRVYNPLSEEQEANQTVQDAYGDEIGAAFIEVRDILIDNAVMSDLNVLEYNGVVFIDYDPDTTVEGEETSLLGTYVDYGPKNEVYLAPGQAITFAIEGEMRLSVGLKAPNGATQATVTNGSNTSTIEITAASDQYYPINPYEEGLVIIKNAGSELLSVTKLKLCYGSSLASLDMDSMESYANNFNSLPVVAYTLLDRNTEESVQEPEQGETDEPEQPGEGNVVIENPEEPEEPEQEEPTKPEINSWIQDLIRSIRRILRP